MPQHLLTRGAVDTQLRDGSVPVLEMFGECGQAVEAVAFQRVRFDVAAAAFSDAVLLRMTWARRQRDESPMRGKRCVHLADVRVVQQVPPVAVACAGGRSYVRARHIAAVVTCLGQAL